MKKPELQNRDTKVLRLVAEDLEQAAKMIRQIIEEKRNESRS